MSIEILLLGVLVGITLLGYMVAINSHGPTRLSVSYLIATLILAGTVWAVVQYVNYGADKIQQERYKQLQREKEQAEDFARTQERSLLENRKRSDAALKINEIISQGTGYASDMMNVDLKDFSVELDVLAGRANQMKNNIAALVTAFENLKQEKTLFPESIHSINEALGNLTEAAKYYQRYFRAEDSIQEELRERLMRQKAREAYDLLKKVGSQITSSI
jgi:hypothetical protein